VREVLSACGGRPSAQTCVSEWALGWRGRTAGRDTSEPAAGEGRVCNPRPQRTDRARSPLFDDVVQVPPFCCQADNGVTLPHGAVIRLGSSGPGSRESIHASRLKEGIVHTGDTNVKLLPRIHGAAM
jgi:hypothetical protein